MAGPDTKASRAAASILNPECRKMTARSTFFANSSDLPAIQREVKRHDMRFVGNPAAWVGKMKRMSVTVETDDMGSFSTGCAAIYAITNSSEPEQPKAPWWRRLFS